jgi:hypothetical protein
MILAALLLFLAAPGSQLVDEVVEIPAAEWRYLELNVQEIPVTVVCRSDAPGSPRLRLALVRSADLRRFRKGDDQVVLAAAPPGERGLVRFSISSQGAYAIFLDNREDADRPARVHLRVFLERPQVRYPSRARQFVVVLLSSVFLFGVLFYAGRRLLRGL